MSASAMVGYPAGQLAIGISAGSMNKRAAQFRNEAKVLP